jgi:hypothetical protein
MQMIKTIVIPTPEIKVPWESSNASETGLTTSDKGPDKIITKAKESQPTTYLKLSRPLLAKR